MKIRNGFVSNSSASSFLVKFSIRKEGKVIRLISDYMAGLLMKYGFVKTEIHDVEKFIFNRDFDEEKCDYDYVNYGYDVLVNQDEVIYFLLKNGIPFEASCHYDDYRVTYGKNEEYFIGEHGQPTKVSDWIENYEKWNVIDEDNM